MCLYYNTFSTAWGEWGDWGTCDCSNGVDSTQSRSRSCAYPTAAPVANATTSSPGNATTPEPSCSGDATESKSCSCSSADTVAINIMASSILLTIAALVH